SSESMMAFRSRKTVAQLARIFGIAKILKEQKRIEKTVSNSSIQQMIESEILKNISVGNCRLCDKKLEFGFSNDEFYFRCPDKTHEGACIRVEKTTVRKAVDSLKIKCRKCSKGQMILQYGGSSPFLGCDQYRTTNCTSKLELTDKYRQVGSKTP
ncbi:hypothetical protein MUP77_17885, partial [Candidatus Bathyarchaeota archaeon]|nr:hypothetical protein [Candidatus Bathyarchaeota archaeon]